MPSPLSQVTRAQEFDFDLINQANEHFHSSTRPLHQEAFLNLFLLKSTEVKFLNAFFFVVVV